MGMPTPSMPQNPTNQPMQQHQMDGKGGGKGMSGSGMATPPVSQANAPTAMDQGYRSTLQSQPMPNPSNGKGAASNPNDLNPDGGNMTLSSTSGQAQTGQPNPYANTTGSWDNSGNQQPQAQMGGKGKGA
jgi:hypothetical protein